MPRPDGSFPFYPTPPRRRATVIPRHVPTVWCNRGRYVCKGHLSGHGELEATVFVRTGPPRQPLHNWALIVWSKECQDNPRLPPEFRYFTSREQALAAAAALDRGLLFSCVDADPPRRPRLDGRALDQLIHRIRRRTAEATQPQALQDDEIPLM